MTRRQRGTDRHLARTFCKNARSFHSLAVSQDHRSGRTSLYYVAIAVELALKAYLLHLGTSDEWKRVHLRHNLSKALRCARMAGLENIPEGISELAEVLGPPYASGALSRDLACPALPISMDADRAITALLATVETIIRRNARAGG